MHKLRILVVPVALVISVLFGVTTALASPSPGVPYHIRTLNGKQHCMGFAKAEPKRFIVQVSGKHCRDFYFRRTGVVHGFSKGDWETYNGYPIAAVNCDYVATKTNTRQEGTTWINWVDGNGNSFLVNPHCDSTGNCDIVAGADNQLLHTWRIVDRNATGWFTKINYIGNAASDASRRANCTNAVNAHTTAFTFQRQEKTTCTRFINSADGKAFSLPPGAKIYNGEALHQVSTSQAWKFCFSFSNGHGMLRLKADQSYALSGYKHVLRIYKATGSANQQFTERKHNTGIFYFRLRNRNGVVCNNNGSDVVEACPGADSHWTTG